MKMRKFLMATLTVFSLLTPLANAEIVTVNGSGVSETAAIQDAKRNAVEQVVGAAIRAQSSMADLQLIFDIVETRTQGYVNYCEIISRNVGSEVVTVTARIDVSSEPNSSLMKDIEVVMNLHDPRVAVVIEYYGDDGGNIFRRDAERCAAAIREELLRRGFTHIADNPANVDYIIHGNLSVAKAQNITIPNFADISNPQMTQVETGLAKFEAIMDGKIKRVDTGEFVGEFRATGKNIGVGDGGLDNQAVARLAENSALEVRNIFNLEASKIFKSVRVFVRSSEEIKILQLEEILSQTQGVSGVHVRNFAAGQSTIDIDTDLSPQNLYRVMCEFIGLTLQGITSTTLTVTIN